MKFAGIINTGACLVAAAAFAPFAGAQSPLEEAQNTLARWVEVEKDIADAKAEWKYEREVLKDMIALLKQESAAIEERVAEAREQASQAEEERRKLNEERESSKEVLAIIEKRLPKIEAAAVAMYKKLPEMLQSDTFEAFKNIPQGSEMSDLPLSNRIQNVVALVVQADKFNTDVTTSSYTGTIGDLTGETEIRTIFFGLAGGFRVNAKGTVAEQGLPGADGWSWSPVSPEVAARVKDAISMIEDNTTASFVPLPVTIK